MTVNTNKNYAFKDYNFVAQSRMLRVFMAIELLRHGKYKINELAGKLDTTPRTAYRYIDLMESIGLSVEEDFDGKHFITECPCPFCGK